MKKNKDAKVAKQSRSEILGKLQNYFIRYRVMIFIVFVALVYSYVLWQINSFNNATPTPTAISDQTSDTPKLPHIDQKTVKKIEQLKDNSVNVQGLFDKARDNPFSQ